MTEPTTRLHITPLNPDILPSVLPPSVRPSATDISFHTLPTFPENNYGYITLPAMEAEKIQKKLNGKILKGKKFRIETARPSKRQRNEDETEGEVPVKKKKSKKPEPEDGVLEGFELPSGRKVKRGWTESKKDKQKSDKKRSKDDKKDKPQPKSKYTDKSELLFRTNLPPNRASAEADDKKAKKKKKSSRETIVHEFEKTYTQPSFLRSSGDDAKPSTAFDEEKGWVDASGAVTEPASKKSRKDNYRPGQIAGTKEKRPSKKAIATKSKSESPVSSSESEDWTSSSGSSGESSDSESDSDSSDNSSDDSAMEDAPEDQEPPKQTSPAKSTPPTSDSSDSESKPEPTKNPEVKAKEPTSTEVHPLEALFKRTAQTATEDQPTEEPSAGFSFFGNGDFESEDEAQNAEPQAPFTPFTKRDLQDRGLRSAAPTPDTTMINRRMTWADEDDIEDDASIDTPVSKSRTAGVDGKEDTEFTKWFWENRGDNNRAWKKRRRDAAKEQRQRENRKKGMKGKS